MSNSLQLSSLYVIHLEVVPYCFSSASLILRSFLATSPSQLDILSSISHLHLLHTTYTSTARSNERVKMDDTDASMTDLNPGVSVRNGPIDDDMDVDAPTTNGNGIKRKSSMNGKSYKDATESEDEDDVPLVCRIYIITIFLF